jgi:Tir chaperone protein (CesT) family
VDVYKPPAAESLIKQLGDSLGIPELTLDNKLACLLVFDRSIPVNIAVDAGDTSLVLMSYLGPATSSAANDMLAANYLWRATKGATLALDASHKGAILLLKMPLATLSFDQFRSQLNGFVDTAATWQKSLAAAPNRGEGMTQARPGRPTPRLSV